MLTAKHQKGTVPPEKVIRKPYFFGLLVNLFTAGALEGSRTVMGCLEFYHPSWSTSCTTPIQSPQSQNVDKEGRDLVVYLNLSSLLCWENHSVNGQNLWKENPEMSDFLEEKLGILAWQFVSFFDKDMGRSWVGFYSLMIWQGEVVQE